MQTLVFNTSTKSVKLYEGRAEHSDIIYEFTNIPTVKVLENFYEIMQIDGTSSEEKRVPVARLPIANTNMIIKK
jgi:hypothetical protein